ncbi:NusA antitermination factor [Anopheles sinensis]|uniref:NusA antitermination factor n=1 Tax=Anopheles sinensis TaxID=74873 RepID=A0A084VVU7_ANOSI|nr:NusA antitermination factor [Anopheles sinensis]
MMHKGPRWMSMWLVRPFQCRYVGKCFVHRYGFPGTAGLADTMQKNPIVDRIGACGKPSAQTLNAIASFGLEVLSPNGHEFIAPMFRDGI